MSSRTLSIVEIARDASAASNDGRSLPTISYTLSLDKIDCVEESDGLGSDDFWLTILTSTIDATTKSKKTDQKRWRDKDVDSGESKAVNCVLFEGDMMDAITVSLLGLEVDLTGPAETSLTKFEASIDNLDASFLYSYTQLTQQEDIAGAISIASGAALGAIAGAIIEGGPITLIILGYDFGVIPAGSVAGGLVGGAIGAAVGVLAGLIAALIIDFAPPEVLVINRTIYNAAPLRQFVDNGILPDPRSFNVERTNVNVDVSFVRGENGDLIEQHRYRSNSEGSEYILWFRHHFVIGEIPIVYELNDYQGRSQRLEAGGYPLAQLRIGNDVISSVKVPAGWKVTLYEHEFEGRSKVLTADTPALPDFDDLTSSIIVERGIEPVRPTAYEHYYYQGNSQELEIGQYGVAQLRIGNDVISSVKVPAGWKVTLYEHEFEGRSKVLTADTPALPDFNDITSSIIVERVV